MYYKDDDIEFANRLLARREELNDEEVTTWLKEKDHVELLDEIAAIRQKLSGQSYGENSDKRGSGYTRGARVGKERDAARNVKGYFNDG